MPSHTRQVTLARPAAVAVHNDGYMPGQAAKVKPFEEPGFLRRHGAEQAGTGNFEGGVVFRLPHRSNGEIFFTPQS